MYRKMFLSINKEIKKNIFNGKKKKNKNFIYHAKNQKNIWDVTVDNIVISKLVKTKTSSKYLIGYLEKVIIRPLVLNMFKIS